MKVFRKLGTQDNSLDVFGNAVMIENLSAGLGYTLQEKPNHLCRIAAWLSC